jgi:hypothetical protein
MSHSKEAIKEDWQLESLDSVQLPALEVPVGLVSCIRHCLEEGKRSRSSSPTDSRSSHGIPDHHQITDFQQRLLRLARLEAWEELIVSLQASSSETILFVVEESMDEEGGPSDIMDPEVTSLLHVVCTSANVPLLVVEMILDLSGGPPSVATIPNHLQQTPLHITLHFIPERTDIVDCLVRAAPEGVHLRDTHEYVRPIDILYQKLIMREEVIKLVSSHSDEEEMDYLYGDLDDLWETAKILAQASCSNATNHKMMCNDTPPPPRPPQPIVHSCLLVKDFPVALTERAMKRYWKQLRETNADGDLPLHVIARVSPPPKGEGDDDEEDEEDDDEGDFLDRVVSLYPLLKEIIKAKSHWWWHWRVVDNGTRGLLDYWKRTPLVLRIYKYLHRCIPYSLRDYRNVEKQAHCMV